MLVITSCHRLISAAKSLDSLFIGCYNCTLLLGIVPMTTARRLPLQPSQPAARTDNARNDHDDDDDDGDDGDWSLDADCCSCSPHPSTATSLVNKPQSTVRANESECVIQ